MSVTAALKLGRHSQNQGKAVGLLIVGLVLLLVAACSVAFGTRAVPLEEVISALGGAHDTIGEAAVWQRLPRTLLALLVGGALGISGVVMQGVTRNPLADPGILGVTTGASLAVVVGISFFGLASATGYVWVAILGASVSAMLVYLVGSLGPGGATPLKLALAGAAMSAAFSSLISAVLLPRIAVMDSYRFWQIGSVGGAEFSRMLQVLPYLAVGATLCLTSARGLNMLALGDDLARGLGQRVGTTRALAAAGAILLCAGATAVAGPIGFVGIVVPHVCRLLVGPDHRWLLPYSALVGGILLAASDVVGRVIARPDEVQVGIITAIVGAPVFIAVVRRQKARSL